MDELVSEMTDGRGAGAGTLVVTDTFIDTVSVLDRGVPASTVGLGDMAPTYDPTKPDGRSRRPDAFRCRTAQWSW